MEHWGSILGKTSHTVGKSTTILLNHHLPFTRQGKWTTILLNHWPYLPFTGWVGKYPQWKLPCAIYGNIPYMAIYHIRQYMYMAIYVYRFPNPQSENVFGNKNFENTFPSLILAICRGWRGWFEVIWGPFISISLQISLHCRRKPIEGSKIQHVCNGSSLSIECENSFDKIILVLSRACKSCGFDMTADSQWDTTILFLLFRSSRENTKHYIQGVFFFTGTPLKS